MMKDAEDGTEAVRWRAVQIYCIDWRMRAWMGRSLEESSFAVAWRISERCLENEFKN